MWYLQRDAKVHAVTPMCRGLRITQPVAGILRTLRNRLEEVRPLACTARLLA